MAIETQNGYPSIRITAGERVLRKAAELVPYEGNPRRHGEKQMQALRRSLREFGFLRPLLIDRENRLVAGQAVLQAAMAEGMDVVPCILAEGLTAEQRRAYILADNRLAELAEWDRQALRVELQALNDLGFDLELTGFSLEALPFHLDEEPPAAEEDADAPVQGRAPLDSGRCYQLGRHRMYVGDATSPGALDALMDGAKARLLLTDPPYNVNLYGEVKPKSRTDGLRVLNDRWESEDAFEDFLAGALAGCAGHMEPGAAFYLWHASMHAVSSYRACARSGLGVRQQLIWVKQRFILGRQDYQWQHEPCLYGWKPGAAHRWEGDRRQGTVLHFDRPVRSAEHPTMKPVKLFDYLIRNSSRPGDIVLDPFAGSGTTLAACEQSGRTAYVAELDPGYAAGIADRWRRLAGEEAAAA